MIEGTYGVSLDLDTNADLTGATAVQYVILKPSGKRITVTGAVYNPTQGIIRYTTQDGDFDEDGDYQVQGVVDVGATKKLKTEIVEVEVLKAL